MRPCKLFELICADGGPLRYRENYIRAFRSGFYGIVKSDVKADYDRALYSVKCKGARSVAGSEIFVLIHRIKKIGLVVFADECSVSVENAGGVVALTVSDVRRTARNYVYVKLFCERADLRLYPFAIPVAKGFKVGFRQKSRVPHLGQNCRVTAVLCRFADKKISPIEIFVGLFVQHIHLYKTDFHKLYRQIVFSACLVT